MSASSERIFGRTRGTNPLKFRAAGVIPMTEARRKLIAKVKIAQKDLGLEDGDYRAILMQEARVDSAAKATDADLVKLLKRFEARGWSSRPAAGKKPGPRPADHPSANKARALLISLHQLGAVESASEAALEAWAKRQLKCDRLQWANQGQTFRLIEALKALAERAGWDQSLLGVKREDWVATLKRRLVERQLAMLVEARFALSAWDVLQAARELGEPGLTGELIASPAGLDRVAQLFGRKIWDAKSAGAL